MELQTWERQEGEPDKAFRSFVLYRDFGANRSLRKVWDQLCVEAALGEQRGSNGLMPAGIVVVEGDNPAAGKRKKKWISGQISSLSRRWRWVERARDWDNYLDRRLQNRRLSDAEALQKQQARAAAAADAVTMVPVSQFLKRLNTEEGRARLEAIDFDDLMGLAIECSYRLRRVQDAQRRANGIVEKPIDGLNGIYEWTLSQFQPERPPDELIDSSRELEEVQALVFPDEGNDPLAGA